MIMIDWDGKYSIYNGIFFPTVSYVFLQVSGQAGLTAGVGGALLTWCLSDNSLFNAKRSYDHIMAFITLIDVPYSYFVIPIFCNINYCMK